MQKKMQKKMRELSIDIETRSREDLKNTGVCLLFCYSLDNAPPVTIDCYHGEAIPAEIVAAITEKQ